MSHRPWQGLWGQVQGILLLSLACDTPAGVNLHAVSPSQLLCLAHSLVRLPQNLPAEARSCQALSYEHQSPATEARL